MRCALAVLLALVLTIAGTGRAVAQDKLPVPYDFLSSAVLAGAQMQQDPPGANDWHCQPSKAHPEPVVLVHGLFGNQATNWQTYAPLLKNNGYCVYALTYGQSSAAPAPFTNTFGGLTKIEQSAKQLLSGLLSAPESTALCSHRPVLPGLFAILGVSEEPLSPGELVVVHHRGNALVDTERHSVR